MLLSPKISSYTGKAQPLSNKNFRASTRFTTKHYDN